MRKIEKVSQFVKNWSGKGDEKQHCQQFWTELLRDVLQVEVDNTKLLFEHRVQLNHTSFIDVYLPEQKVIIEQKSLHIDLFAKQKQSDGSMLTPFEQAKRYNNELGFSDKARWIVVSNFQTMLIYDMDDDPKGNDPVRIELEELAQKISELNFLKGFSDSKIIVEQELSIRAGELIGKLYDGLILQYRDPTSDSTLKSLNKLCVRLVFCLYAEDAGLFDRNDTHVFGNYFKSIEPKNIRKALIEFFEVLNQKPEERDPYLAESNEVLAKMPYVNGNLFKVTDPLNEEIPNFTEELKHILIDECSDGFNWADISPTIFGAVFESTLNQETRHSGGMHYTSVANIHKVIDPLFLDSLRAEFEDIKKIKQTKKLEQACDKFQDKLAGLKFFDPACGSGNFLTETYLSIRQLENELILLKSKNMSFLSLEEFNPVKVSIEQFYGIEINDFACAVATTALWIAESQMLQETELIIHRDIDFLPLKAYTNIVEGNALTTYWQKVIPHDEVDYIMGNPPFLGARIMSSEQKQDLVDCAPSLKGIGNLDYVSGWYIKAAQYMQGTQAQCAFVSTNSITQGEQVAVLWSYLKEHGVDINFAYRTFIWDSEASDKAHVHCVIIGFDLGDKKGNKFIYDVDNHKQAVNHINGYLLDAPDVFIHNNSKPVCQESPICRIGNQPIDGGFYLFTPEEKDEFLVKEPKAAPYFKRWVGAEEFIKGKERWCLHLKPCPLKDLSAMPHCLDRMQKVKSFRQDSKRASTKKLADTPLSFQVETIPKSNYLVLPLTSSERRHYVPIGYLDRDIIPSNAVLVVSDAELYHFGVLTSSCFMSWLRVVCGRLKSDYRINKDNVFNNFIWPQVTDEQKQQVTKTAQAILDARALYKDSSLADLYNDLLMPIELRKAHQANDAAVLKLYGLNKDASENEIVTLLMKLYQKHMSKDK